MKKSKKVLALVLAALMALTTPLSSAMEVRAEEVSMESETLVAEVLEDDGIAQELQATEEEAVMTEESEIAELAVEEEIPVEVEEVIPEEITATAAAAVETKVVMSLNMLTTSTQPINKAPTAAEDTYNHSSADRGTRFQNMLDTYLPDSIGLCEVTEGWRSYLDGTVVTRQYVGNATYAVAGYKSDLGYDLKSGSSEYSPVLYRSDLYTVDANEQGGFWFSSTPDVKSKYAVAGHTAGNGAVSMHFERVFSYAVLRDINTHEIAYIHVNAHYDHNSDEYINKLCSVQIANTIKDLKAKYGEDVAFVITGDHNRSEQNDAYVYLANGNNGFRDAKYATDDRSTIGSSCGYGTDYDPVSKWQIIDHVFVSEQWSVAKHDILVDPYFSDHSAVYTKLVLGEDPRIVNISVNGASYSSEIDNTNNVYFEVASAQATINATASCQLVLETVNADGGVVSSKEFNGSATVDLADGANVFQLVAVGAEARNSYKVTIVKTTTEAYPFVSEIYPNGKIAFAEITNAGGTGVNLGEYEIALGDVEGAVVEASKAVTTKLPNRWLKPGETVVVVYNGGELDLDDVFTTDLNAEHLILASESYANASANGGATLYKNGASVNTSSYAGIATGAVTADQAFVFAVANGKVVRAEYPETLPFATPGAYETEIGAEVRSAYTEIQAATAQVLGGVIKKVAEEKTGDYRLDNTKAGSYVCYANIDFGATSPKSVVVNAAVKKSNAGGTIDVYVNANAEGDTSKATKIASIVLTGTASDWSVYKEFAAQLITPVTGVQNVMLVFVPDSGKTYAGNVTTLKFSAEAVETETDEEDVVLRDAYDRVQCEWAEDMTAGYKKNGSLATPNLQSTGNASNDKTDGYNILGTTTRGATATYKNVDFGTVSPDGITVNLAIKNSNCDGVIRLFLYDKGADGKRVQGDEIANIVIDHNAGPTNDYSKYQDIRGTVLKAVTGKHDLLMYFDVTEGYDYVGNMDYFFFTAETIDAFEIIEAEDVLTENMKGDKITREGKVITGMSAHVNNIDGVDYTRVTGLDSTAEITYNNVDFGKKGVTSIVINTLMNSNNGGTIDLYIDSVSDATKIGTVTFDNAAWVGGNAYAAAQVVEAPITAKVTGVHNLILKSTVANGMKWACQLDYFYFRNTEVRSAFERIQAEWGTAITGTTKVPSINRGTAKNYVNFDSYSYIFNGQNRNLLGNTGNDGTITYKNIDFGELGASSCYISMAIKTSNCGGTTEIHVVNADGTTSKIGYFQIPSTKGVANDYNTFQVFEGVMTDTSVKGVHDVMLKFITDSGMTYVGNIDYFGFGTSVSKDALSRIQFEDTASALTEKTNPNLYSQTNSALTGMDPSTTNGYNSIFNTRAGSSAVYKNVNFGDTTLGALVINMSGKTTTCGGVVEVYTYDEGVEGTLIAKGEVAIKENGYAYFNEMSVPVVENVTGTHDIIFKFPSLTNAAGYFGNLDYFYFVEKGVDAFSLIETEWVSELQGAANLQYSTKPANMSSNVTNNYNLLGNTKDGSAAVFKGVDFGSSADVSQFTVNIAMKTGNCAGTIDVYTYDNGVQGDLIATMTLDKDKATDGGAKDYNTYKEYSVATLKSDITGIHDIILKFSVPSLTYVGNIDYFYFSNRETKLAVVINGQRFMTDTTIEAYVGDQLDFQVECDAADGAEIVVTDSSVADYVWADNKIVINGSGSSFIIADCYSDYSGEQLEIVVTVNVIKDYNDYGKNLPYMHTAPATVNEGEDYKVTLKFNSITESTGVEMFYNKRDNGTSFTKVTMTKVDEDLYEATIPGSAITAGGAIQYYFAEVGAKLNTSNKYSIASGESLYAMQRSDIYYVPIKTASITSVPELIITEMNVADSDSNLKEYVVLHNTTDNAIDLSGYTMKKYFTTTGYDSTYTISAYVLEAHKSVVLWKNGRKGEDPELLNKYYNTNVDPKYIVEMSGGQFPVSSGYGLTIFKGDREVSSIMYRYTDSYCTDGNVKFGIPATNTNVCPIVDNSTDNEAVNFTGIDDQDAVEDAARLLTLGDDLMIMSDIELPTLTTHGCAVTWRTTNADVLSADGKLLAGDNTSVTLTATITRNGASVEKSFKCTALAGKTYKVTYAAMMDENGNTVPTFENDVTIGYVLVDRNVAAENDMKLVVTGTKKGEVVATAEKTLAAGAAEKNIRVDVDASFTGVDAVTVKVVKGEAVESNNFKAGTYLDGRKIDLFVIGDSITQFYKLPNFPTDGWGAQLENYIDDSIIDIRNYGKSGRSLNTYFAERNFYDVMDEVRPGDYVLIQLATNDAQSSTAGIYEDVHYYQILMGLMMAAIEEKGAYPILVESSYTHPHDNATKTFSEQPNIAKYNAAAEKVAIKYNAVITSIYDLTKNLIAEEGFEGMKDIMQYKTKNDLRYIEDDYLTYRGKTTAESLTDSFHYLNYGSNLQAKTFMTQLKATGLPISAGIDLSYEPIRKYYREMSFNGVAVSRATYGATYTDSVAIEYSLGAAPSGTVKIDGEEIASGATYDVEGQHVLELFIDENNTNTIPFTIKYSDAKKAEIAAALKAAKDDAEAQVDAYAGTALTGIRAEMLAAALEDAKAAVAAATTKEEVAEILADALAEIDGIVTGSTLANSWVEFNGKVYYFDANTKEYAGRYKIVSGVGYNFAADGSLVSGTWLTYPKGTRYYYAGEYYTGWNEIEGVKYYFDANGYLAKGVIMIDGIAFILDETTGAFLGEDAAYTGFIKTKAGTYYYIGGVQQSGWVQVDGTYYYFNSGDDNRMRTQDKIVGGAYYYINSDGTSDGIGIIVAKKGTKLYRAGVQIFDETVTYNGVVYVVGADGWVVK